jgi:hypothetical protein
MKSSENFDWWKMNENSRVSVDMESIIKIKTNKNETIQEINSKIGPALLLFINHPDKETW